MKRQPPSPSITSPSTDTLYRLGGKYKRHDHGPSPSSTVGVSNSATMNPKRPLAPTDSLRDPDLVFLSGGIGGNDGTADAISPQLALLGGQECGNGRRWTKEEDEMLRAAVAAIGPRNWKRISQEFLKDSRSDVQCLHRWQKVLRPGLVKGPWTREEDDTIVHSIQSGVTKWSEIAAQIPGRIGKQCRERWFNHLDPTIKKGAWTEQEDGVLIVSRINSIIMLRCVYHASIINPRLLASNTGQNYRVCIRRRNTSSAIVGVKLRSCCPDDRKTQ